MEGHSSSCLISAESNGAMLGGKCCAGEPSLPLTLPSNSPALCYIQPPISFRQSHPKGCLCQNSGSQGYVVSEHPRTWKGHGLPDPRSSCSHVVPLRSLGPSAPALFGFRAVLW